MGKTVGALFQGQGTTLVGHVVTAVLVLYLVEWVDHVKHASWWPLAYLSLALPFFYLQRLVLIAGASHAHYNRRRHPRLIAALAVSLSWLIMLGLLWFGSTNGFVGAAYQFMYVPMSYTWGIPVPALITGLYLLRILTARFRVSTGMAETPVMNTLPYLLAYLFLLPSAATYYLGTIRPWLDPVGAMCLSSAISDQAALGLATQWRDSLVVAASAVIAGFYLWYALVGNYPRRPETQFVLIAAPMFALLYSGYGLASVLTAGICDGTGTSVSFSLSVLLKPLAWNLEPLLIGWVSVVPVIIVGAPFLVMTLNDPLKQLGWRAERIQLRRKREEELEERQLAEVRHTSSSSHVKPDSDDDGAASPAGAGGLSWRDWLGDGWWRAEWEVALLWTRASRAQFLAWAIWRNNMTALILALPISLMIVLRPLLADDQDQFLVIGLAGSSVVWLGVLVNGLYSFHLTALQAFESGLSDAVRRLNEHTIIVGYDDLGRRLASQWARRNLLGYLDPHDHFLRGPNIMLPDGRLGRLMANVAVVDEPLPSGIGLVTVGPGVRASVVSLTDSIRPMHREMLSGDRLDPVVIEPADSRLPLLSGASRVLARVTRDYDQIVNHVTEFYAPLVAGDAAAASVREVARFDRARFVVSNGLLHNSDSGFMSIEAVDSIRLRGPQVPLAIQLNSSSLAPHIASRTTIDDAPVHAVSIERLEAAEATRQLASAILGLMRQGTDVQVLLAVKGKKLFHLLDGIMALLDVSDRKEFGDQHARGRHRIVVVSLDGVIREVPAVNHSAAWQTEFSELKDQGLEARLIEYAPYVSRYRSSLPTGPQIADRVKAGIVVTHVKADCRDLQTTSTLDRRFRPNVILISDSDMVAGIRALNSVSLALARREKPASVQLFIAAERSRWFLSRYYRNALAYSSGSVDHGLASASRFPALSDGLIDPVSDAVEKITGLWSAYANARGREESEVVELHACSTNQAGAIADTLVKLCGGVSYSKGITDKEASYSVSLLDTRLETNRDRRFTVSTLCRLETGSAAIPGDWPGCRLAIHNASAPARRTVADHVLGVLGVPVIAPAAFLRTTQTARDCCCGMLSCPIEATHKVIGAAAQKQAGAATGDQRSAPESRLAERYWAASEGASVWTGLSPANEHGKRPLGFVTVACRGADERGTFAVAVATLLGWVVSSTNEERKVVQLTYLSGGECHDSQFGLFSLYGFTASDSRAIKSLGAVIVSVEVTPISDREQWKSYSHGLTKFMNETEPDVRYEVRETENGFVVRRVVQPD